MAWSGAKKSAFSVDRVVCFQSAKMSTAVLHPPSTTFNLIDYDASKFRDYSEANQYNWRVRKTYTEMHKYQTVAFVKQQVRP